MKRVIDKILNWFGYVPFDKQREIIYQAALESGRRNEELVVINGDFGDRIEISWKHL